MDIHEIKVLIAVHVGNEEFVLKNAGGKKLAGSNDYFVVTDDGICHLFDANGIEKDISAITTLSEDIVSKDIKKIVIPNSVTSIDDWAFYLCSNLTNMTMPNSVTNIGKHAFYGCSGLTSVTIPDSVTSIEFEAFYDCNRLTNVTISDSVTSIETMAFASCTSLASAMIPSSVTSIGDYVFYQCNSLKSLVFKSKTLEEVKDMDYYPFGIGDELVIKCIDEMHTAA